MQGNQLKAGTILNYTIILLNTLVGLLYTPFMIHTMGQSEYGLYALVASVISYLTILDLGLGNAVIRYTAKLRAENKTDEQYEMFGTFIILYSIIGVVALVAGVGLLCNLDIIFENTMTLLEVERAQIMMVLLIFNLCVTFPMSIFGSIITAYEHFVFPRIVNICRIILNTLVMVCLLKMGYKAIALVIVQTIFNILSLFLNYIYCKKQLRIKVVFRRFKWSFLKEVGIYSFWIFLNVIMDKIYWSTGQFVLGAIVGTTAVAVYAVSIQLQTMYMQFSTAISSVFLPKVTAIVTTTNDDRIISDLFIRTGRIQYIIMSLIFFGFIVFGRQFIQLWVGTGYEEVYLICILFFASLLVPLIQNLGISVLQAKNQMKFRSILYVTIAVLSLIFQIIFAKKYGGIGCAIAVSGALLLGQGIIMNVYYSRVQHFDIKSFWKEILRMSIVPILLTVVAIGITSRFEIDTWTKWVISIAIYCIIYIPLFWVFSMNQYERAIVVESVRKIISKFRRCTR
jgi:O-antigen/teichoic acid export membrane protein